MSSVPQSGKVFDTTIFCGFCPPLQGLALLLHLATFDNYIGRLEIVFQDVFAVIQVRVSGRLFFSSYWQFLVHLTVHCRTVAYGCVALPNVCGHSELTCRSWRPLARGVLEEAQRPGVRTFSAAIFEVYSVWIFWSGIAVAKSLETLLE